MGCNPCPVLSTWAGKSKFSYEGSVNEGTKITFGSGHSVFVSKEQYVNLLNAFQGRTVNIGTSRDSAPKGSIGEWLQANVTKTAIASYVGPILINEGYAEKVEGPNIKVY